MYFLSKKKKCLVFHSLFFSEENVSVVRIVIASLYVIEEGRLQRKLLSTYHAVSLKVMLLTLKGGEFQKIKVNSTFSTF